MIHCQHCGTDNLDGSEFCDECGMRLAASPSRAGGYTPPLPPPPAFTTESVQPRPAQPFKSAPEPTAPSNNSGASFIPPLPEPVPVPRPEPRLESKPEPPIEFKPEPKPDLTPEPLPPPKEVSREPQRRDAAPNEGTQVVKQVPATQVIHAVKKPVSPETVTGARLVIVRGGQVGKEFQLAGTEAMIGRWDADRGIFPDIDLDSDDPEAKVSRRHARVIIQAGPQGTRYFVEDLGSTNGTFVNRQHRLRPGQIFPLSDGDEIIVGKTFLKLKLG